ncbi:MAG: peptidase family [Gammaproteobacteria bacterium]|jgi:zinc protease|nr:peptidase family [Gammaproteobacteria bacterium]
MRHFIIILCTLIWLIPSHAATPTREYTLNNGLKLLVRENHRSPIVVSQIWYKVGSAYETAGITGISHALEHMMFKGTPAISGDEFNKTIAENGGVLNAITSFDNTHYYEQLAADKLPISFKLEADRMQNLKLTSEDFAKEIQVVMEERRLRTDDNPQAVTQERLFAAAHLAAPYHHLPIGWMSDLQEMTVEDLRAWYHTWYAPNNAIIVVAGDVQSEQVYQLAEQYFGNIPAKTVPKLKKQPEPPALGQRSVTVKRQAKLPYLLLGYNVPTLGSTTEAWQPYALTVLAAALDSDQSTRLAKNLVRGKQLAVQANAEYDPYQLFSGLFILSATPASHHSLKEIKIGLLEEVKALQNDLLSEQELTKLKTLLTASYTYSQDDLATQASFLGNLASIGLPWQLADDYVEKIQAVTAKQVQQVAKQYLISNSLTTAELLPTQDKGETHE